MPHLPIPSSQTLRAVTAHGVREWGAQQDDPPPAPVLAEAGQWAVWSVDPGWTGDPTGEELPGPRPPGLGCTSCRRASTSVPLLKSPPARSWLRPLRIPTSLHGPHPGRQGAPWSPPLTCHHPPGLCYSSVQKPCPQQEGTVSPRETGTILPKTLSTHSSASVWQQVKNPGKMIMSSWEGGT